MKYRAFLSYSHADRKWARWLHRKLEAYVVPRELRASAHAPMARVSPIFLDRDELPSTASLSSAVNDALGDSEWLIVLCSPDAAASHWVNEEIRSFRRLRRTDRVLAYIVAGEPFAGDRTECLPPALTEPATPGSSPVEPVAADARREGDGRSDAVLKIVAGMLGVGFDALKQREQHRRYRRLAVVTAASVLIAALTIGLAVTATIARNDANARRAQAEDLIDFMLGDLRERLRAVGRLDLYQSIGDKALEYFAAQSENGSSDYSLAQRAKNLRQIGEVRLEQGQQAPALVAFEQSESITARLAERDTGNAENQIALANSHYWIGQVHWERGELAEAREQFELVVPIVDAVSAADPDNAVWLRERGYAYTNLGRVLELQGALDAALGAYEKVLTINERLVELEPNNIDWTLELGFAHNNIGKVFSELGRLDEAERAYRYDLAMKTRVLETDPQHNTWRSYQAVSEYFLGQLLVMRGAYAEAETHLRSALGTFEDLTLVDPSRVIWQGRLANVQRELGQALMSSGRVEQGLEQVHASVDLLTRLSAQDEADASSRRDLARGLVLLATTEVRRGEIDSATAHHDAAESHIETLLDTEPTSRDAQQLMISSDVCAALISGATNAGAGEPLYARALERVETSFRDSSDPQVLALKAAALEGLDRPTEAREIDGRLQRMGYAGR